MKTEFDKISKEMMGKFPNKRIVVVIESDTNGVDKYVTTYESHNFKNGIGYYLGSKLEQVKMGSMKPKNSKQFH